MDHYIDIELKPDAEMPINWLSNAVYTKFHRALHDLGSTSIGFSSPNVAITLGKLFRLHGSKQDLDNLKNQGWLGGISGYCQVSDILPVPENVKYRTVSRVQPTMSPAKLKRLVKRGSISKDEIIAYKAKMFTKGLENPYLELLSQSNGQRHRRYIKFGPLLDAPVPGEFDQFGLSKNATIPWF